MGFKKEVLLSELKIMLEKEREMKVMYDEILKDLDSPGLYAKISRIRNDEVKHMGLVEIIIGLMEDGPEDDEPAEGPVSSS
jgi:rubrerythrin